MTSINYIFTVALMSLSSLAMAQGETCASALAITPGTYTADGPSSGNGCNDCVDATNADWYSYTPSMTGYLSIRSCSGGADTRLFLYKGACGSLSLVGAADDGCDLGNGDFYATELNNIQVCAGTTYYLEWDDRWETTGFTFTLSFDPLNNTNDLVFQSTNEYTMLPLSAALIKAGGTLTNMGLPDITAPVVNVSITKDGNSFIPDFSLAGPNTLATSICAPGTTNAYVSSNWLNFSTIGSYQLVYNASAVGSDPFLDNNRDTTNYVIDTTMARDNGIATGSLSIDDSIGGIIGQNFILTNADNISSVYFRLEAPTASTVTHAVVYSVDANGLPIAEIGRTIDYTISPDDEANGVAITLPMTNSGLALAAGQAFFVGVVETTNAITLSTTEGIYMPRKNWAYFDAAWHNGEDYGFTPTYILRPNFGNSSSSVNTNPVAQLPENISISPNPTQGDINVSFTLNKASDISINIIDMTGRVLISSSSSASAGLYTQTLNLNSLANGLYTVQVITNEGDVTQPISLTK